MNEKTERLYIKRIYLLLIAFISLNQYLESFLSSTIIRTMELGCLVGILFHLHKLSRNHKLIKLSPPLKSLCICLFIISFGIIIRGNWPNSIKDILLIIISPSQVMAFILPFIILPLPNSRHLTTILKCFYWGAILVIPIWLLNSDQLIQPNSFSGETIGAFLPFFAAFLLGFLPLFSKKKRIIIIAIWGCYFILMLLNARRNVSFSLCLYGIFSFCISNYEKIKKSKLMLFPITAVILLLSAIITINSDSITQDIFQNMSKRINEDTRSGVEKLFFTDFINSPIEDWIVGRGMDGSYKQETLNTETGEISTTRNVIETGYLHMILKGGILYALTIIIIIIFAMKKVRKNRYNIFIFLILASYLVDNYTTNPISLFSVRSIIFWFCISILTQDKFNNLNNKRDENIVVNKHSMRVCSQIQQ